MNQSSSRGVRLLGTGVLLFVLGCKLGLIHFYGTDQPYNDQWAAEGVGFLQAPLNSSLDWNSFFWSQGEHRPAVTRFITRGLIVANDGQWDCYLEVVFNLLIYAALLLVAWKTVLETTDGFGLTLMGCFMALLFAQPACYENLLWGFQSCFISMLFFGLFHVFGTLRSMRVGALWCCAQVAGFCGLFSIASGMMSSAALVFCALFEIFRGRRDAWSWATLGINAGLLAYGLWLIPISTAAPEGIFIHCLEVITRMAYLLSWPLREAGWCILFQMPWICVLVAWVIRPGNLAQYRLLSVLGLWLMLVSFSIGYGRAITPDTIGVRYYDVIITSVFVNALCLAALLGNERRLLPAFRIIAVVWLLPLIHGLWDYNNPTFAGAVLRQQKRYALEERDIVRQFIATDDSTVLADYQNRMHRLPNLQYTIGLLRDVEVRKLLPPSLSVNGMIGPLSRFAVAVSSSWKIWVASGFFLIAAGCFCCISRTRTSAKSCIK